MFKRKKMLFVIISIVLVMLSTSVMAQEEGKGGRLVVNDPDSNGPLDPFVTPWHSTPHYAIFSTLFAQAEDLSYVGFLADTWEVDPSGQALSVNLIDYATFTDGTPVNAEAIKWNLERQADPDVGSPGGADLVGLLTEVEVTGEYSFTIKLERPFAPLVFLLSGIEIASPTAYEEMGADEFGLNPIGAGPFILTELNTNNYMLFERNPDFTWAPEEIYSNPGPVYLDELQVLFLTEEQTILAALETGEIHTAPIPPQNLSDAMANPDIDVNSQMMNQIRYVGFNTSKAPWDNADLRRAFSYATNRVEVVTVAWDEQAAPLYQPLPPTIWGHNPDIDADAPHYDPEAAMALLDELGYVDANGDGMRDQPDGSEWVVPFNVGSSDEWRRQGELLAAQWSDIGIPVQIELMEFASMLELTTTGTHDVFLSLYGYSDPLILTYFFDPERKGGSNRAWYSTDELTELLLAADSDMNQETRFETITEISQYLIDESPWVFLLVPNTLTGVRTELMDWRIHPASGGLLYWDSYFEVE